MIKKELVIKHSPYNMHFPIEVVESGISIGGGILTWDVIDTLRMLAPKAEEEKELLEWCTHINLKPNTLYYLEPIAFKEGGRIETSVFSHDFTVGYTEYSLNGINNWSTDAIIIPDDAILYTRFLTGNKLSGVTVYGICVGGLCHEIKVSLDPKYYTQNVLYYGRVKLVLPETTYYLEQYVFQRSGELKISAGEYRINGGIYWVKLPSIIKEGDILHFRFTTPVHDIHLVREYFIFINDIAVQTFSTVPYNRQLR